jgi:thiamine biosynthesis lipoprotein
MQRFEFRALGSACEIMLAGLGTKDAKRFVTYGIEEIDRIEKKYSRYLPDSAVTNINSHAGLDWLECDTETLALLDYADALYRNSRGLFDVTSGVLRKAWNFDDAEVPAHETLFPLLKLVGWNRVERKGSAIRLPVEGMQLDFGGIGKEYAADSAAEILYEQGVRHGYVNLAGDIRIIGPKPDGEPWTIGIRDPRKPAGMIASIPVASGAIASSGDYERFFESKGRRYCHIINPASGFPVSFWRSVTVLAPLATTAGSCTTIAMLLESEGLNYLKDSGFKYLAVDQSGRMHYQ